MPDSPPGAPFRIDIAGEAALLVTLGERVDVELNGWVHRAAALVAERRSAVPGLGSPVPGYASLLIPFDPDAITEEAVRGMVESDIRATQAAMGTRPGPLVEIPVRYGGADGPDLVEVASRTGLTPEAVIGLHAGTVYQVFLLGFVPGFPYLGVLPPALVLPRRPSPRVEVAAGSVAIAGLQTGVYPFASPGGWHVIGRTDAILWEPRRDPPALLAPGTRVRFVPVLPA